MVVKAEQERVKTLIADTVSLLCKNGLHYTKEFCIEGLLGITLDRDEVFLVNIKELVKSEGQQDSDSEHSADETPSKTSAKRKRRRSKSKQIEGGNGDVDESSNDTSASFAQPSSVDNSSEPPAKKSSIKEERTEEVSDDEDLVFIKDEPGQDFSAFTSNEQSFSGAQTNNILGDLSQQGSLYATPTSAAGIASQGWDPSQAASFSQQSLSSQPNTLNASGQQQLKCPVCARPSSSMGNLKRHLLIHEGKYRYSCEHCGKGFSNKYDMLDHLPDRKSVV